MEALYGILGLGMLYSIGHFFIIQHTKNYKKRTGYERFITWSAIITIVLIFIGVMFP